MTKKKTKAGRNKPTKTYTISQQNIDWLAQQETAASKIIDDLLTFARSQGKASIIVCNNPDVAEFLVEKGIALEQCTVVPWLDPEAAANAIVAIASEDSIHYETAAKCLAVISVRLHTTRPVDRLALAQLRQTKHSVSRYKVELIG